MMDSFDQYPQGIQLNVRKEIKTRQQIKIVIKSAEQLKYTPFYDKDTFDYKIMFIDIQHKNRDILQEKSGLLNYRKTQGIRNSNTILQQNQKQSQEGNWKSQSKQIQNSQQFNTEQQQERQLQREQKQKEPASQQEQQQQNSSLFSQKQQLKQMTQLISAQEQNSAAISQNYKIQKSEIQQSAISRLNQVFRDNKNQQNGLEQQQISIFKISADFSSININKDESLADILKKMQNVKEQEQQMEQNSQQKSKKFLQMQSLPLKNLIFVLKTSNCYKICLKMFIDPLGDKVKIKKVKQTDFLNLDCSKIIIEKYEPNQQIEWRIGTSKVQIKPIAFALTCYSCRNHKNIGIVNLGYCSVLCSQLQCKKQIIVQIKKSLLQLLNQ